MTVPSATAAVDAPDLEAAGQTVRNAGLRLTSARRMLLEALYRATEPLSAEDLTERIGSPADLPSVYRNLEAFENLGLVRHFHFGHGPSLYARTSLGRLEYLVCDACGARTALDPSALDPVRDLIRGGFGFEARFSHFPITGLCPDCSAARAEDGSP